jgi:ribose/xylose/arabinose/galactoside ABC-type transport system permease subunit
VGLESAGKVKDGKGDAMTFSPRAVLVWLLTSDFLVLALALGYFLAILPFCPALATKDQAAALLVNSAPLLVLVLGQLFVLVIGAIDLSVSSVISLAGVVGAMVMADGYGLLAGSAAAIPGGLLVMLLMGLALGALHGVAVAWLDMPAFLVTLASMMVLGGSAVWLTGSKTLAGLPVTFLDAIQKGWLGIPTLIWVAGMLSLMVHLLLRSTVMGRQLFAVGHNARAARVSGLPVGSVTVFAFAASGFCSALAAILYMGRSETATPAFAREILLDVIGAAVIGGISLSGGRGSALGAVIGALFITLVGNSLTLLNMDYWHVLMAKGAVILLAAFADASRRRLLAGEGRP